jgi:hypothetical protein
MKCPKCGSDLIELKDVDGNRYFTCSKEPRHVCHYGSFALVIDWQDRAEKAETTNAELEKELAKVNADYDERCLVQKQTLASKIELEAELSKAKARVEELEKRCGMAEGRIARDRQDEQMGYTKRDRLEL